MHKNKHALPENSQIISTCSSKVLLLDRMVCSEFSALAMLDFNTEFSASSDALVEFSLSMAACTCCFSSSICIVNSLSLCILFVNK